MKRPRAPSIELPFTQPEGLQEGNYATFCDELHDSDEPVFYDPVIDVYVVPGYYNIKSVISGQVDGVTEKVTLDGINKKAEIVKHPALYGSLLHLLTVPHATANADPQGDTHKAVRRSVFRGPHGLSLSPKVLQERWGEAVKEKVQFAENVLAEELQNGKTADFCRLFARPLSVNTIAHVLGVPDERVDHIRSWSDGQTNILGRLLGAEELVSAFASLAALSRATREIARDSEQNPGENLITQLSQDLKAKSPRHRLAGAVAMNNIAAGDSTTYGAIPNMLAVMLEDRSLWDSVNDPELADGLFRDLERSQTSLIMWLRGAKTDVVLPQGGGSIPKGAKIGLLLGAGNRDPKIYDNPHQVNPLRYSEDRAPEPLTFGHGPHLCMGRELARLMIRRSLQTLQQRFPDLEAAKSAGGYSYGPDYMFRTLDSLPVRLLKK